MIKIGYKKSLRILQEKKNELSEDKKYKLAHKINRYWNSPLICENCFEEVKSISNNLILGRFKWVCKKCEESVVGENKGMESSIPT